MYRFIFLSLYLCIVSPAHGEAKNYAVFYLDKTGSMNDKIADGSSRCDAEKKIAKISIKNFFEKWSGRTIDVRVFAGPGNSISLTGGFTDSKSKAFAAIDDSPCDGPSTALADALCEGADLLRLEFSALADDTDSVLMLVAATDGEENSSTGPCGGTDWRSKVEEKIKSIGPRIRLNMSIFGELHKIAAGTSAGSSMASDSLAYFSRLANESGGTAIFIDDYARNLPDFMPIFPNDESFIAELKANNLAAEAWGRTGEAESLGYEGLRLDADSLEVTQKDIQALKLKETKLLYPVIEVRPEKSMQ